MGSADWSAVFDCSSNKNELRKLEKQIQALDFWQKPDAKALYQNFSFLKQQIESINKIKKEAKDIQELSLLVGQDEQSEINDKIDALLAEIAKTANQVLFSGKYDKGPLILSVSSGAGGRDAQDWSAVLLRMYQRYCERKGWSFKILEQSFGEGGGPKGRIGIKEAFVEIKGRYAYGILKNEIGVHRLVRISPFSTKHLRHTSFAQIEVMPMIAKLEKTEVVLNPDDLKVETFKASGPGGQYVNKRQSAVRITHLPTGLSVSSQEQRLLGQNRKIAEQLLRAKIIAQKEKQKAKEMREIKGERVPVDFGQQIRSYVLHPYKMVKDHRINTETSNTEAVLDGDLDIFLQNYDRI